jgi:ribbon-helix-helix CopG family protein
MARRPVTVNLDEQLLEALARAASDEGVERDALLEEALRRYFGLRGVALLDDIAVAQARAGVQTSDEDGMALAVTELRAARAERSGRRASG